MARAMAGHRNLDRNFRPRTCPVSIQINVDFSFDETLKNLQKSSFYVFTFLGGHFPSQFTFFMTVPKRYSLSLLLHMLKSNDTPVGTLYCPKPRPISLAFILIIFNMSHLLFLSPRLFLFI